MSTLAERTDPFEVVADTREESKKQAARDRARAWGYANRARQRETRKAWRLAHPEKEREYRVRWRNKNPDKIAANFKRWSGRHPEKKREIQRRRDPMENRLRSRMHAALRGLYKSAPLRELVGCSPAFLRNRIEEQFLPGMTWENRRTWHVDHVVPLSWFPLHDPEWQHVAFHYSNLRPIWKMQNMKKGARYAG